MIWCGPLGVVNKDITVDLCVIKSMYLAIIQILNMIWWGHTKCTLSNEDCVIKTMYSATYKADEDIPSEHSLMWTPSEHDLMRAYQVNMIQWEHIEWIWYNQEIPHGHDPMKVYCVNIIQWHTMWTWSNDSIPDEHDPVTAYQVNMIHWQHTKWPWSNKSILNEHDLLRSY